MIIFSPFLFFPPTSTHPSLFSFKFMVSFHYLLLPVYLYVHICTHVPKYRLLGLYNVICMCVFRADLLVWITSYCALSWGELLFPLLTFLGCYSSLGRAEAHRLSPSIHELLITSPGFSVSPPPPPIFRGHQGRWSGESVRGGD